MQNQDPPKAGEPATRVASIGSGYWEVQEWISNTFCGSWHAFGVYSSKAEAEKAAVRS